MTTKERIEADIKKNATAHIDGFASDFVTHSVQPEILEQAQDAAGRRLTNLATAGTQAGDKEIAQAIESIEQKMAKAIVVEIKKKYNIK